MDQQKKELLEALSGAEKVLIGIGGEWKLRDDARDVRRRCLGDQVQKELREAYAALWSLVRDKDYYVVTTVTDGAVYDTDFDSRRVVAPCGNIHWRQCSKACTKDIWEEGEVPDDICTHCKAPLTGNTVEAETYIEEGYLPRWEAYKKWQTGTLNRRLVILELGEGFKTPTVMRWPFEKIGFFNQKSIFYRIHENFYQMPKELGERAAGIQADSVSFIRGLAED
ncbi:hypothetical protein [Enterocloster clostridioformis]|uniref:hypothetical protein n=1 Tax=Enterocloster clostridioformis TaxID=1531 RepID=UPI0004801995